MFLLFRLELFPSQLLRVLFLNGLLVRGLGLKVSRIRMQILFIKKRLPRKWRVSCSLLYATYGRGLPSLSKCSVSLKILHTVMQRSRRFLVYIYFLLPRATSDKANLAKHKVVDLTQAHKFCEVLEYLTLQLESEITSFTSIAMGSTISSVWYFQLVGRPRKSPIIPQSYV
ncbi:hypothetical protein BDZ45DRAFT_198138 [Acephala macrosclerotiorum]|nr:hypothetical protein BDZ45DRAFT_198138 [Acephala macrosclerotiorum]